MLLFYGYNCHIFHDLYLFTNDTLNSIFRLTNYTKNNYVKHKNTPLKHKYVMQNLMTSFTIYKY